MKKKSKGRTSSREKSKDRSRFNSKFPFHKKAEALDELAWALDHNEMLGGAGAAAHAGAHGHGHGLGNQRGGMGSMRPPGSVRALDSIVHSPASVGAVPTPLACAMTPKGGPGSVRTPGDFASMNSPADCKPPHTPKSVPPSYPVASPYPQCEKKHEVKSEFEENSSTGQNTAATTTSSSYGNSSLASSGAVKSELTGSEHLSGDTSFSLINLKRPMLPVKEYEAGLQSEMGVLSDSIYDTEYLQHWLNHPVKKFRPSEPKNGDPLRPMYRPKLGQSPKQVEGRAGVGGENNASAKNSAESSNDNSKRANALNSDPYEFSDGQDIKKEVKVIYTQCVLRTEISSSRGQLPLYTGNLKHAPKVC